MIKTAYIVSIGQGMESFIYREVEEMIKRGVDITLYTTKYNPNDIFSPKKKWKVEVINFVKIVISFFVYLFSKPINTISLLKTAIKFKTLVELLIAFDYSLRMKKQNIEYIHCHFGDRKFFIAYYCKEMLNIPLSLTVHAHELYANPNEPFFRRVVHEADKIVCISQKNKEILINKFDVNPLKIKVIRLSIDLNNFQRKNKIKVLTVARYTERKGFKELFEAIKILNSDEVEFITIGFGDLDLHGMVKSLNIKDKVTIFNKMGAEQLRYFYNNCDIFCLPSKSTEIEGAEGIPVVLMEAMASEMIIVTTPNGSILELVDEVIVNEGDSVALAKGLEEAFGLTHNFRNIGKRNREKVINEYGEKNIDALKMYLYE
jgi:colanic acid/amylovoran biosynthesis glycosyltransferase